MTPAPHRRLSRPHEVAVTVRADLFGDMSWHAECLTCRWRADWTGWSDPDQAERAAEDATNYHRRYGLAV